jgi:hypothetical protein
LQLANKDQTEKKRDERPLIDCKLCDLLKTHQIGILDLHFQSSQLDFCICRRGIPEFREKVGQESLRTTDCLSRKGDKNAKLASKLRAENRNAKQQVLAFAPQHVAGLAEN